MLASRHERARQTIRVDLATAQIGPAPDDWFN
jgi:hypothetical protein